MKFLFLSSHAHYALDPLSTYVSGGAELQVALLARELAQRGNEVTLAGGNTGQENDKVLDGVRTLVGGKFHTGGLLDACLALPRIIELLLDSRPEFVTVFGWTAWLYLLALLRPLFGYKLIFICGLDTEIDGTFSKKHGWRGHLFELGVKLSDYRFAMSDYQSGLFSNQSLTHSLYRSLILPRKHPRSAQKSEDFLWIGRCQNIKRPHLFLDLAERLPDSHSTMICSREDIPLWEGIAARAKTLKNVTFLERVSYHSIQEYYDRAKLLVSTSEAEGVPNVMIQAAQGGAGIISLEMDPDGMIARFEAGFCAYGNFEALVTELERLLVDSAACAAMGEGSERIVLEWLDNEKNTAAFLEGLK
jgi:glycosyltransferase involved in cell wall biosynthesis